MIPTVKPGTGRRLDAPALEWSTPPCPSCGDSVASDGDYFWCELCSLSWTSGYDSPGRPTEEDTEQCGAMLAPFVSLSPEHLGGRWYRCILDDEHRDDLGKPTKHYGLRSDRDPWAPDGTDDYQWDDDAARYGRSRVIPIPAQGPTTPPKEWHLAPGPVVAVPPREEVLTADTSYL